MGERMQVITDPREWAGYCRRVTASGHSLGFVPTMGALHSGHAELLRQSLAENAVTALSIFVNPTQFNDTSDLEQYPRTLEADLALAEKLGVQAVFLPDASSMYPDDGDYRLDEQRLSRILEGAHRPGHFSGVLTIVMKLLLLTAPNRAYFGEKDYQQYVLIKRLAEAFFLRESLGTEIVLSPLVREESGLALSSRNQRLSDEGRRTAARLYQIIRRVTEPEEAAHRIAESGMTVEYLTDTDELSPGSPRRYAAVQLEGVRLIDNLPVAAKISGTEDCNEQ